MTRYRGLFFPAAAALLIFVILIPLPAAMLDFMLITNIMLTAVIMMTVMYIRGPLEFSSFPSLLLAMTLLRLVLNTATTRIILTNGAEGTAAAGQVIQTFGHFVAGNSLAVGVIIFLIIMIIQFVVITKGATRIAEVAARFTLDGMPGKQMAIDADLNAGIIDENEAKRRREAISREADFFGAMDGASKFVRGDAVAGLVITAVNILGGLYIGMVEGGLGLSESVTIYTNLSIGDGLASQIPAFIISVAAGMLVTRSTGKTNLGEEVLGQLFAKPTALVMAAAFLAVMALTPLPKTPLITLGAGCGAIALLLRRQEQRAASKEASEQRAKSRPKEPPIESHLNVDALEMQVGYGLVKLVDRSRGGDMLDRIAQLRKQVALDLGLIVPPIRIRDNAQLEPNAYQVRLRGQEIARGELFPDQLMAIDSGMASERLRGIDTREPAFNLPAVWIGKDDREHAQRCHYTIVEPTGAAATHLTEIIRRNAAELLTRSETQRLIDHLKLKNEGLVEEVIPNLLRVADVQRVLQNLLRERVPIRDLEIILETLGDWAPKSKDTEVLTEYVRNALSRTIVSQYTDEQRQLHCVTVDPQVEDLIQGNVQRLEHGSSLTLAPQQQTAIVQQVKSTVESAAARAKGASISIVTAPTVRLWLRRIIEGALPQTPVLGLNEVTADVRLSAHGVVSGAMASRSGAGPTAGPDRPGNFDMGSGAAVAGAF